MTGTAGRACGRSARKQALIYSDHMESSEKRRPQEIGGILGFRGWGLVRV